jgi:2-polyprenyl-3-methyl-5-hydroxy-6-metoxy-1,4-benzoquinol methylase
MTRAAWDRVMDAHSGIALEWGPTNVDRFLLDPKRIAFFMSRYKFAAKMLHGCRDIIDVGCGDGMGTLALLSDTGAERVLGIDFEEKCIEHAVGKLLTALRDARPGDVEKISFACRDWLAGNVYATAICDGILSLDVIEHIESERAPAFLARIAGSLRDGGVAVIGTPNIAAAEFGSEHSKIGHINLYDAARLRDELRVGFRRVFMFSMNDEVVHTGFDKMAHYLIAVCVK